STSTRAPPPRPGAVPAGAAPGFVSALWFRMGVGSGDGGVDRLPDVRRGGFGEGDGLPVLQCAGGAAQARRGGGAGGAADVLHAVRADVPRGGGALPAVPDVRRVRRAWGEVPAVRERPRAREDGGGHRRPLPRV